MTQQAPKSNVCSDRFHLSSTDNIVCYNTVFYNKDIQQNKPEDFGNMEAASTRGVLSHLSLLEVQARSRKTQPEQQSRVVELKAKVEALMVQRDKLRAETETHKNLQKLRLSMDRQGADDEEEKEEEGMDEDSENAEVLHLMARQTQLKDLLDLHHLIGGYDVIQTRQGKGVCVSVATAYQGVYLDTYNLEIDLRPAVRIARHNVPPFVPLKRLAEQSGMQTDLRTFLDLLSQNLNGFSGRCRQLQLVKEQHGSVEVMESNVLCSILVLMFSVPRGRAAFLCRLDYTDLTRCLPTAVHFECTDERLPESPQWKMNCSLLLEVPVHRALTAMKKSGSII
ncbi:centromere protein O [Brachyistius frenatus]|uniref:centromere protein O n=1 Tax=Brachyistius frenatus TaxID=100188 RepID=UPI0037E9957B